MDHQHTAPPAPQLILVSSLHPHTQRLKHSNILAKFPHKYFNSLRACLIPSVPHALSAIYMHWQSLGDDTTRYKWALFKEAEVVRRGDEEQLRGWAFLLQSWV